MPHSPGEEDSRALTTVSQPLRDYSYWKKEIDECDSLAHGKKKRLAGFRLYFFLFFKRLGRLIFIPFFFCVSLFDVCEPRGATEGIGI